MPPPARRSGSSAWPAGCGNACGTPTSASCEPALGRAPRRVPVAVRRFSVAALAVTSVVFAVRRRDGARDDAHRVRPRRDGDPEPAAAGRALPGGRPADRDRHEAYDAVRGSPSTSTPTTEHAEPPRDGPGAAVPAAGRAIRFEDVRFRYPGRAARASTASTCDLPSGRCTAIVGVNGAGKTTLVKLLTRLLRADRGPRHAWTASDLARPSTSPRGAPGQRDLPGLRPVRARPPRTTSRLGAVDVPATEMACRAVRPTRRASPTPSTRCRPGCDTPCRAPTTGGADLSGGQWQRVAIARSLYALRARRAGRWCSTSRRPRLDVRAEAAFFDRFVELTRGRHLVLISHRFSSVRRADRIVVIDAGRVVEQGTHDELIAADGHYARLFRLQADRFAAGPDADGNEVEVMRQTVSGALGAVPAGRGGSSPRKLALSVGADGAAAAAALPLAAPRSPWLTDAAVAGRRRRGGRSPAVLVAVLVGGGADRRATSRTSSTSSWPTLAVCAFERDLIELSNGSAGHRAPRAARVRRHAAGAAQRAAQFRTGRRCRRCSPRSASALALVITGRPARPCSTRGCCCCRSPRCRRCSPAARPSGSSTGRRTRRPPRRPGARGTCSHLATRRRAGQGAARLRAAGRAARPAPARLWDDGDARPVAGELRATWAARGRPAGRSRSRTSRRCCWCCGTRGRAAQRRRRRARHHARRPGQPAGHRGGRPSCSDLQRMARRVTGAWRGCGDA